MKKNIVNIATFLINVQTIEGVVETMNRIAVLIDGYSETVATYFDGLYKYIDSNDRAFQPLTEEEEWRVKRLGARLILSPRPCNAVTVLVKLHYLLKWNGGDEMMIELSDNLWDKTDFTIDDLI